MKKTAILVVIFCALFYAFAFAEATIKAEVDKKTLSTEETLTYKVTVSSFEGKIPKPTLPEFKNFQVLSSAHSSSVSFAQGKAKSVLTYIFVLGPVEAGKFGIESASIKTGDEVYHSEAFDIEVAQGKLNPFRSKQRKPASPGAGPPGPGEPEITL